MPKNSRKKLTPLTSREYVQKRGMVCPFCDSEDITGGSYDMEDNKVYLTVICRSCKREWEDIYELTGYEPYEEIISKVKYPIKKQEYKDDNR